MVVVFICKNDFCYYRNCLYNHKYKFSSEKEQVNESQYSIVSRPGLGSDPPIGSDREWGVTLSVYGSSFEHCMKNLETVLQRFQDKNLALNLEKCHFMVTEEIVLGHKISIVGLEVNKAKVYVIETLMPPNSVKEIISFLGHVRIYRRFIKDF